MHNNVQGHRNIVGKQTHDVSFMYLQLTLNIQSSGTGNFMKSYLWTTCSYSLWWLGSNVCNQLAVQSQSLRTELYSMLP